MRRGEYEEIEKQTKNVEVRETEEGAEDEKGGKINQTNKHDRNSHRKRAHNRGLEEEGMCGRRIEGIYTANRKCWTAGTHVISSTNFIHIYITRARVRVHTKRCTHAYTHTRARTHTHTCLHAHTYARIHYRAHAHTHTHTRTHAHTHIYIYCKILKNRAAMTRLH